MPQPFSQAPDQIDRTPAPAPSWAGEVTEPGPLAGIHGPAQLALFLPADLEPAPPGRTRLPGRIKSLLTKGTRRKSRQPTPLEADTEPPPRDNSLWPDSFFED